MVKKNKFKSTNFVLIIVIPLSAYYLNLVIEIENNYILKSRMLNLNIEFKLEQLHSQVKNLKLEFKKVFVFFLCMYVVLTLSNSPCTVY